jgi:hypothetical protein
MRARVDLLYKLSLALAVFPLMLLLGVDVVPTSLSVLGTFGCATSVVMGARAWRLAQRLAFTHRQLMSESGGWRTRRR